MKRVYIICEGQTEETFVNDLLVDIFARNGIYLTARMISSSPGHRGGALSYDRVKRFVVNTLKEDPTSYITTFFDLYALDNHFPSFTDAMSKSDVYEKSALLEEAFYADIVAIEESARERFFPHIQPYEFEALLFSDIEKALVFEPTWGIYADDLVEIRNGAESPEHINDGYETKPSARLTTILSNPSYKKRLHGSACLNEIGIDAILRECHHFNGWYNKLLTLRS